VGKKARTNALPGRRGTTDREGFLTFNTENGIPVSVQEV
jgi:hypothetical protein